MADVQALVGKTVKEIKVHCFAPGCAPEGVTVDFTDGAKLEIDAAGHATLIVQVNS